MTLNQRILNFIEDHNNVLNRLQSILSEWDVIVESLTELDHLDPLKLPSCYFFVCSVGGLADRRGITLAILFLTLDNMDLILSPDVHTMRKNN